MSDLNNWFTKRQRWYGSFVLAPPVPGENQVFKLLANGATTNMNVDGSSTAVAFDYTTNSDQIAILERSGIIIQDTNIGPDKFGGLAALDSGLKIEHIDADGSTVKLDFTADITIKKNIHFGLFAGGDVPFYDTVAASAADALIVRWTIGKTGSPLLLLEDEIFRVTVQDNLEGLEEFYWMVQGQCWDHGVFDDIADSSTDR